ncbi:hypothetical protein GCM10023331_12690 [Algivirga pacifica]|uniref:histidine kinase n=2 Tax=Algivirga pacifica TaxID=1162670 RepID=A0ABP9DAA8_9BACT
MIKFDEATSESICLTNDIMLFLVFFLLFYLFDKESKYHIYQNEVKTELLEDKNQELEHFAYLASHDLNEPLRTVKSFVEIINDEYYDTGDKELNIYFQFIYDAIDRMQAMIRGLLEYSKLGENKTFEKLDIQEVVNEIEVDLSDLLKTKQVDFQMSNLPVVTCLPIIKQVFQNLIVNGIKFQEEGSIPQIQITHQEHPTCWEFCVEDNGIGIQEDVKGRIFRMFDKLHLKSDYEGHGIGLAFCKKIVETHNGRIWVESTLNEGSRFSFTIPKVKVDKGVEVPKLIVQSSS